MTARALQVVEQRSVPAKIAAGLLFTAGLAALAHFAGTDIRAGYGAGRPDLAHQLVRMLMSPSSLD